MKPSTDEMKIAADTNIDEEYNTSMFSTLFSFIHEL